MKRCILRLKTTNNLPISCSESEGSDKSEWVLCGKRLEVYFEINYCSIGYVYDNSFYTLIKILLFISKRKHHHGLIICQTKIQNANQNGYILLYDKEMPNTT